MFVSTFDYPSNVISEVDADGFGEVALTIFPHSSDPDNRKLSASAARLLIIALNMDGGISCAIDVLRAHAIRQKALMET